VVSGAVREFFRELVRREERGGGGGVATGTSPQQGGVYQGCTPEACATGEESAGAVGGKRVRVRVRLDPARLAKCPVCRFLRDRQLRAQTWLPTLHVLIPILVPLLLAFCSSENSEVPFLGVLQACVLALFLVPQYAEGSQKCVLCFHWAFPPLLTLSHAFSTSTPGAAFWGGIFFIRFMVSYAKARKATMP